MKGFVIPLTGAIFVILLASTIQSVDADHVEEFGQGIFKDEFLVNFTPTKDTKWIMHLQVEIRNAQNQLVTLTETVYGYHIPHEITDYAFYTLMGEKEIVTIDNIKYEKVQYTFSPTLEQRWIGMYPIFEEIPIKIKVEGGKILNVYKDHSLWKMHYCADFSNIGHDGLQCIPVFQVLIPTITLEPSDVIIHHWTILRELN